MFWGKRTEDMTDEERGEREQRRQAIREQILSDQRTGAKRDAETLEAERRWYIENGRPLPDYLR